MTRLLVCNSSWIFLCFCQVFAEKKKSWRSSHHDPPSNATNWRLQIEIKTHLIVVTARLGISPLFLFSCLPPTATNMWLFPSNKRYFIKNNFSMFHANNSWFDVLSRFSHDPTSFFSHFVVDTFQAFLHHVAAFFTATKTFVFFYIISIAFNVFSFSPPAALSRWTFCCFLAFFGRLGDSLSK